jgi:hypothetical protein
VPPQPTEDELDLEREIEHATSPLIESACRLGDESGYGIRPYTCQTLSSKFRMDFGTCDDCR